METAENIALDLKVLMMFEQVIKVQISSKMPLKSNSGLTPLRFSLEYPSSFRDSNRGVITYLKTRNKLLIIGKRVKYSVYNYQKYCS